MNKTMLRLLLVSLLGLVQFNAFAQVESVVDKEWRAYVDALAPIGQRIAGQMPEPGNPQLRQELYAMMFSEIAAANIALLHTDPKHPDWWPLLTQSFNNVAVPNPDNVYYATPIDDDGVYRISGYRGTVRLVNFQIGAKSLLARGNGSWGPTLANYDLDDGVHIGKDGSFEVILSPTRPKGYKGDWWQLMPGAIYVRRCRIPACRTGLIPWATSEVLS